MVEGKLTSLKSDKIEVVENSFLVPLTKLWWRKVYLSFFWFSDKVMLIGLLNLNETIINFFSKTILSKTLY